MGTRFLDLPLLTELGVLYDSKFEDQSKQGRQDGRGAFDESHRLDSPERSIE